MCIRDRDVRDTAHPGVYAKAKILVLSQFRVQILVAHHAQLIADRLFLRNLHLDAGIAVAVLFAGYHADFLRKSLSAMRCV